MKRISKGVQRYCGRIGGLDYHDVVEITSTPLSMAAVVSSGEEKTLIRQTDDYTRYLQHCLKAVIHHISVSVGGASIRYHSDWNPTGGGETGHWTVH
jgi:hypothetical protein